MPRDKSITQMGERFESGDRGETGNRRGKPETENREVKTRERKSRMGKDRETKDCV